MKRRGGAEERRRGMDGEEAQEERGTQAERTVWRRAEDERKEEEGERIRWRWREGENGEERKVRRRGMEGEEGKTEKRENPEERKGWRRGRGVGAEEEENLKSEEQEEREEEVDERNRWQGREGGNREEERKERRRGMEGEEGRAEKRGKQEERKERRRGRGLGAEEEENRKSEEQEAREEEVEERNRCRGREGGNGEEERRERVSRVRPGVEEADRQEARMQWGLEPSRERAGPLDRGATQEAQRMKVGRMDRLEVSRQGSGRQEPVRVLVRCRPLCEMDGELPHQRIVTVDSCHGLCTIQKPKSICQTPMQFTFDAAFSGEHSTEHIYREAVYPLVESVTEGYNSTIFAYGQTGSGKTFTMQGVSDPATQRGIIPMAFEHIFESIQCADNTTFLVRASHLEIYNNEIRDLLGQDSKKNLELKEHPEWGIYVKNLSMHTVRSVAECEQIMEAGCRNRIVGHTMMNKDSSRSHSIFTIHMEICTVDDKGKDYLRAGKLNLVDLAGSERQSKTGPTGERIKESTKINLSLSALGNVISALVDEKCKHIPYRDSKLTRLLQDSLGGNTKTLMVACLSPLGSHYHETLSTLRYASRARNIKNKPCINEDPKDALLREYQDEIQNLKELLTKDFTGIDFKAMASAVMKNPPFQDIEEEKQIIRQEYEEKLSELKAELEESKQYCAQLEEAIHTLQITLDQQMANMKTMKRKAEAASLVEGILNAAQGPGANEGAESEQVSSKVNGKQRHAVCKNSSNPQFSQNIRSMKRNSPKTEHAGSSSVFHTMAGAAADWAQTASSLERQLLIARLALLESQVVGGEHTYSEFLKEMHTNGQKKHVDESRTISAATPENREENSNQDLMSLCKVMQKELQSNYMVQKKMEYKLKTSERDNFEMQCEFEMERTDYMNTISAMRQESRLWWQVLKQVVPLIHEDCNYRNLEKIREEAYFDEDSGEWEIPDVINKNSCPQ